MEPAFFRNPVPSGIGDVIFPFRRGCLDHQHPVGAHACAPVLVAARKKGAAAGRTFRIAVRELRKKKPSGNGIFLRQIQLVSGGEQRAVVDPAADLQNFPGGRILQHGAFPQDAVSRRGDIVDHFFPVRAFKGRFEDRRRNFRAAKRRRQEK